MAEARIDTYLSDVRRYDELLDHSGAVRAHWRPLIDALAADGAEAVRRGVDLARRLIVENGVTYNVYADPQGRDRPWVLDPCRSLLTAEEWREIELGVTQRARLFDALLADLYGPQHLLGRRRGAGRAAVRAPEFSLALSWHQARGRPLAARVRGGCFARRGRALVGARGPHADSFRAGLCIGESAHRLADLSRYA
jgi:hypothetical protein